MFTRKDFEAMTQAYLGAFIKLHSGHPDCINKLIGSNPISPLELTLAKKIHKLRNRRAFEAAKASRID